jgi:hypothetical protein
MRLVGLIMQARTQGFEQGGMDRAVFAQAQPVVQQQQQIQRRNGDNKN